MKPFRVVLLFAAFALVPLFLTDLQAQPGSATPGTTPTANVSARTTTIAGQQVGEVVVGETVVLRLREPAGGYTVGQRADIVANRMQALINQGYGWQDVRVAMMNNEAVLTMGGNLLVTADQAHARLNQTTPTQLAFDWQGRTQTALIDSGVGTTIAAGGTMPPVTTVPPTTPGTVATVPPAPTTTAVAGAVEQWPDWTNTQTRIVPIVSAGTPGVRLGLAQITGPEERVKQVDAVFQLDLVFQRAARIAVFVPSSNLTGINRVQGVAVTALLQYRLFQF